MLTDLSDELYFDTGMINFLSFFETDKYFSADVLAILLEIYDNILFTLNSGIFLTFPFFSFIGMLFRPST